MSKLTKAKAIVDNFITKASKTNDTFDAMLATDTYKDFETSIQKGIKDQATWVANNIDDLKFLEPEATDENINDMEAALGTWLFRFMPHLGTYVSEDEVFEQLKYAFEFSVKAQLTRSGYVVKAVDATLVDFELTNEHYIAALKNQANYLLSQKSKVDETTRKRLITLVRDAKLVDNATIDEIAALIDREFDEISIVRATMIANTETNQAMSTGQKAFMVENGVETKAWVAAGPDPDEDCLGNEAQGFIPVDAPFEDGSDMPPAHINCHCYVEAGEIDLEAIDIWEGE